MAKSDSPMKEPNGYLIGETDLGEIRRILARPVEEHDALFAAWMKRIHDEAQERARLKIDKILDEHYFPPPSVRAKAK
jgi:hypothetical protein